MVSQRGTYRRSKWFSKLRRHGTHAAQTVIVTHFLTRFHFGWGWLFIVLAFCNTYYATSMKRVRARARDDIQRELKTRFSTRNRVRAIASGTSTDLRVGGEPADGVGEAAAVRGGRTLVVCSSREIYFVDMENCARVSRRLSRDEARVQIAGDDVGGVRGARCETKCRKWPAILRDSGCFVGATECIVGATECIVGVQRGAGTVGCSAADRRVRTRRASQKRRRHHGRLRTRTLLSTMISSALSSRAAALLSRRRLLRICDCSVSSAKPKTTCATFAAAWTSCRWHPPLPPPSRTHRSSPNWPGTGTREARCVPRYSRDRHRARCIWRSCSNATRWRCLSRLVGPSSSCAQ